MEITQWNPGVDPWPGGQGKVSPEAEELLYISVIDLEAR